MQMYLPQHHHPEHPFWAGGQIPMMGPPAQPNQVIYPILSLPENRPRLTREQWAMLEHHFSRDRKPTTAVKRGIAQSMNVPLEKINNWFQNRRAKERQEQKKAEAAARDGRPLPDSFNSNIPVRDQGDQQTLQIRPISQPTGSVEQISSLKPPQLSGPESLSHPQATVPSPSDEFGHDMQNVMPISLPGDTFEHHSFVDHMAHAVRSTLPTTMITSDTLPTNVYPSPDQTCFSSPEQYHVASQSLPASASQSPEGLPSMIPQDFAENILNETMDSSHPGLSHLPFVSSDSSIPDIAFQSAPADSVLSSALTSADRAPFLDGFSPLSTPTYPLGHFDEHFQSISSQAASNPVSAASEIPDLPSAYFELSFTNDMLNNSTVPLPAASEHHSLDQLMPPPDSAKLFQPRQSSQPNLAARRRKNAPGAILVNPSGSMGRSGSYTAGMPHPLSPRSPHLAASEQTLRRIKSSNNTAGRIQKPMTPAQKSPLFFTFSHHGHLLDNQTPPPSASIVDSPAVCDVAGPSIASMFPPDMNFNVPWSAPPTQQAFLLSTDFGSFSGPGILSSTPSPTAQPQNISS